MTNERFAWENGDIEMASCARCIHKALGKPTCDAFPQGIPDAILSGDDKHTRPYPGDHGIQFEPVQGPSNG